MSSRYPKTDGTMRPIMMKTGIPQGKLMQSEQDFLKTHWPLITGLFDIPNVEADQMDPQQRHVLECVYRAMEDGGITREQIGGKNVGVYVGAMNLDYGAKFDTDSSLSSNYTVTGVSNSLIAARVSYVFDFRGPSMTIDTACSSGLAAVHLGVQALRAGDCDFAVCGGTNLINTPDILVHLAKANMLGRGGQCFAFSDKADGYTRGEGCGMVILKRLSDVTTKDKVWATIETGCNQDGHAISPVSAPSKDQQFKLLQKIYAHAETDPKSIQYIEAHGTGTPIGDPTEVNALGQFFNAENFKRSRYIGSVKTNIGHLESGAGIAGLIKVLLMMKHSQIVPSLFFDKPNPKIDFEALKFIVPTKVEDWNDKKKRACINSFGFGGTNCHAIINAHEKQSALQDSQNTSMANSHVICFSGQSQQSLIGSIKDLISYPNVETFSLHDISYTSTVCREHHKCRQAFVVKSMEELLKSLDEHLLVPPQALPPPVQQPHHIVFVFCGMGSDWVGMGVEMMRSSSVFRAAVQQIDQILKEFVDWSLENRLKTETDQDDLNFWPIAIFACHIGLAKLWESLGVTPNCVVGHSMGEVAAAHVAGILSLKDAVKVIYARTKVLADLGSNGRMIVVRSMPLEETRKVVGDFSGQAEVSVEISPVCCAVSADSEHISKVRKALLEKAKTSHDGVNIIDLPVSVGYHSHCVEPCKEKLAQMLQDVSPTKPKISMISTVTGKLVQDSQDDLLDNVYWVQNLRECVKFFNAVHKSWKKDCDNIYIEVGPKPFMGPHVGDIFPDSDVKTIPSMVKDSGMDSFLKATSLVYEHGCNLKWQNIPGAQEGQKVTPVPRYCFQPRRKLDLSETAYFTFLGINRWESYHPFVFKVTTNNEYKLILSEKIFPCVYDHRVSSELIVPGALHAEVGFAVAKDMFQTKVPQCSVSVTLTNPCRLETGKPLFLDIVVKKNRSSREKNTKLDLTVMKGNTNFASIQVLPRKMNEQRCDVDLEQIQTRCPKQIESDKIYKMLEDLGFSYGPYFSLITSARRSDQECLTHMVVPSFLSPEMLGTTMHPSIIDAMIQTGVILSSGSERHVLPVSIGRLTSLHEPRDEMYIYSKKSRTLGNLSVYHVQLLSKWGEVIAEIEELVFKTLTERDSEDYSKSNWVPTIRNYRDKLEMKLPNYSCVRYSTDGTITADIKALLDEVADKLPEQDFLVLHGDIFISDSEDGVSVQSKVLNACKLLKEVFTYGFKKRIFLFTKWAISTNDNMSSNAESINPIMTAIWGLTRCALVEKVADIVIVDLHLPEDTCSSEFLASLASFIHRNDSPTSVNAQWVATEDALLIHEISPWQPKDEIVPSFKDIFADKSKNMVQVSTETCPFNLYHEDQMFGRQSKTVAIDVAETGLLNRDIFSMNLTQDKVHPQRLDSQNGSAVFAMERLGKVQGEKSGEIVSCYPSITCTKLTVPIEATVKRSLFDSYSLGDLSKLVVLYSLCQSVTKDSVTIIVSASTLGLGNLLQLMFEALSPPKSGFGDILKKMCKVHPADMDVNLVLADQIQNGCPLKKNIISLVRLDRETISHLAKSWSEAKMLVTMAPLLQTETRALITFLFPAVEIMEHTGTSLFQSKNIVDVVPKICKWMTERPSLKATISKLLKTNVTLPIHQNSPNDVADLLHMTKVEFDTSTVRVTQDQMFHKQAVYIVVGGLTGLGWMFVEFLAKNGAGSIAIMNRRKASNTDKTAMETLSKKEGCIIESFEADVIKPKVLKRSMALIKETFKTKPLRGVFFGAAVLRDQFLSQIDWNDFEYVLSSKVMGSWNLHQLTKDEDLDYFVLQSSVTSVFGNGGQSSYAAGNAFMDGLAPYRRHRSLAGQSINWGPLDTGLLESKREGTTKVVEILKSYGYVQLKKKEIAAIITPTLLLNRAQTLQCKLNFQAAKFNSQKESSESDEIRIPQDINLQFQRAHGLPEQERIDLYERFFISLVSQILGDRAQGIQSHSNLRDYGMDSLFAVRVHGEIKGRIGCDLHLMVLLSDPVPRVIAEKINEIKHGQKKN